MSAGIFPRFERGQLLAGNLLSGPSAASGRRSAWGRFTIPWCVLQVHPRLGPPTSPPPRPGVLERKEPNCRCVRCGARVRGGTRLAAACAVLPCSPAVAVALSGNLGVSGPCLCTQTEFPMEIPHEQEPTRRIEHLGVARMPRGRGAGQCGLTPPLSPLKRTEGAPPYELA
jgi:hypothetical protein